jgi:hypothetical protein
MNRPGNRSTGGIQKMEVKRGGSQPSQKGPAENFTGSVRIDPLSQAPEPALTLSRPIHGGLVTHQSYLPEAGRDA